ncbi:hypothetical protein PHLCEN_2v322 [Hermanssonia centrifuga]|uniref:Uncharacterized protein n=1 Tax=Hermanssonia centrifuga TaxID=98765 RepID=A0A2R6S6D1_9APHY|nr:hypothetical protein PHLCEN_2v322 [Hermanssonia centrifuga]
MSSPSAVPHTFPAPIGGVPFNQDFAPSILFAFLYAIITIIGFYRLARSSSRCLMFIGTLAFVFERIVIYGLRAHQAHDPSERASDSLTVYWQMTYSIGYVSILADIITILRSFLVNSTYPPNDVPVYSRNDGSDSSLLVGNAADTSYISLDRPQDDQPRARFWFRRICGFLALSTWISIILGTVSGLHYVKAETNANQVSLVQSLRYACTSLVFIQVLIVQVLSLWAFFCVARLRRSAALILFIIATLLNIVSVYRLVVMRLQTPALVSTGPSSLNDPASKVTFYVFQAAPEWIAAAILVSINVRQTYGTGMWGDFRSTDKKS